MKKVLITGASGFIGSFLVDMALEKGYQVYAGIRKTSSKIYLSYPDIIFLELDFSDKKAMLNIFNKHPKFDYIIHSAGVTKSCNSNDFDTINYQYTKNFIDVLYKATKIPDKFLFISSLAAYGPGNADTLAPIKTTDTPKPISLYGQSKLKAEEYIKSLKDFPYLIFRPTGVYGPREKDFLVMYKTLKQGFEMYIGSKEQQLSLIYVKDVCCLTFIALESEIIRKSYFLSDLNNYSALGFNKVVKKVLKKKTIRIVLPKILVKIMAYISEKTNCLFFHKTSILNTEKYKEISPKNWLCNSDNLVTDFNFKPKYTLEKGMEETIKWYKKQNQL